MKLERLWIILLVLSMLALLGPRASGGDEGGETQLQDRVAVLEAEKRAVEEQLMAEQQRHMQDVEMLRVELAKANEQLESHRFRAGKMAVSLARLQAELVVLRGDCRQARAELGRAGPRESLQAVLGHVPISHWLGQLSDLDARAREIALSVLEDRLPGTVEGDADVQARVREALIGFASDERNAALASRATALRKSLEPDDE